MKIKWNTLNDNNKDDNNDDNNNNNSNRYSDEREKRRRVQDDSQASTGSSVGAGAVAGARGAGVKGTPGPGSKGGNAAGAGPAAAGSKRMFGALMGHLGRAKKMLKEDSEVIQVQVARQQEALQKNSEESKRVAKLRRVLSVEQKEKELILRDTMLLKRLKNRLENRANAWKKLQEPLKHCLVTSTTLPPLAWLPKVHNETTQGLLDNREAEMEVTFAKKDADIAEELRKEEERMTTMRERALQSLRQKNEEWEARQTELASMKGNNNGGQEQKDKEEDNGDSDCEGGNDDEEVEEEEEEEEDILAALDGRIKARKDSATAKALEDSTKKVESDTTDLSEEATVGETINEIDSTSNNTVPEATPKNTDSDASVEETVNETSNEMESNVSEITNGEKVEAQVVENGNESKTIDDASADEIGAKKNDGVFDYEAESKVLSSMTVAQLKELAAEEGVSPRKSKMLKKHYVEDICLARQKEF